MILRSMLVFFLAIGSATAKTLTLAAEEDYYPFSAEVEGELVGLVPEVTLAAFNAVGIEVDFRIGPYSRVLFLVESGDVVGGFTGAIDESNESDFYWHSTPLSVVRLAIWARAGFSKQSLTAKDMEGQKVSVTRGFFYTDAIDTNDEVRKIEAPSDASSLKMLALGRSDYALVTEKIGRTIIRESGNTMAGNRLEIVGLIGEVPLFAFFSKAHPGGENAARLFQEGFEIIIENGTYARIMERWQN
ncbi:MAG: transporter substrate-binding domain-containing protein [Marinobacter sp.]|uniref:substrate-binding periplasmic protein n=1 Tax=Marinobacter sp. TaxID=50741 RepID=UPI0034A088AB